MRARYSVRQFDFEPRQEYILPAGWKPFAAEKVEGFTRVWARKKVRK